MGKSSLHVQRFQYSAAARSTSMVLHRLPQSSPSAISSSFVRSHDRRRAQHRPSRSRHGERRPSTHLHLATIPRSITPKSQQGTEAHMATAAPVNASWHPTTVLPQTASSSGQQLDFSSTMRSNPHFPIFVHHHPSSRQPVDAQAAVATTEHDAHPTPSTHKPAAVLLPAPPSSQIWSSTPPFNHPTPPSSTTPAHAPSRAIHACSKRSIPILVHHPSNRRSTHDGPPISHDVLPSRSHEPGSPRSSRGLADHSSHRPTPSIHCAFNPTSITWADGLKLET
ncbi:hypothetical protein ACLOJK_004415, partial [Asimina triloba]